MGIKFDNNLLTIVVIQEKWDKARIFIEWLVNEVMDSEKTSFKSLEKYQGFLIYIIRIYIPMIPYVQKTIEGCHDYRDDEG